ncbi:MAG: class I SAM-dependent methyltransferase [Nitrospirota bacterium]|nr:class I SAM-dependent methyltransferase [Nitrospirota bacterium]
MNPHEFFDKRAGKREFFNQMAKVWDEKFYTPELKEHLEHLVSLFNITKGSRVLDVGSGTGGIIPYLLKAIGSDGSIRAIDFAKEMVKRAKEKFKNEPRVTFQVASVEAIPFESEFFDHVICFGAFPHFDDKKKSLNEIWRVLKPGGSLIIAHALSSTEIKYHHKSASPVMYDILPEEEQMRSLLESAGFRVERLIDRPKCYLCEGVKV